MSDNKRERCGPQQSHHRPTVSSTNLPLFFPLFASPSSPGGVPPVRGSQLLVRCVRHPRLAVPAFPVCTYQIEGSLAPQTTLHRRHIGAENCTTQQILKGTCVQRRYRITFCTEFGARLFPFGEMVREEGRRKSRVRVCKQLWSLTFWPTLGEGTFGNYGLCSRSGLW
uniref:(northern house mosquito) hypothetical protein n=1 Tax=Culex pipiens TaxID=7175 RepID=A0A8D7ZVZ5_CULPI